MRISPNLWFLLFVSVVPSFLYAQFRGSAGMGITTYRNAEGTDTSSGDRALTPKLQLAYTHKFTPLSSLDLTSFSGYDLYLRKNERSYLTLSLAAEFETYLSNKDVILSEAKASSIPVAASAYPEISGRLTALADSTLALHTGVERTALTKDAIADIQSDVTATLIAYAALLTEMGLTQSFKEVLADELATIKTRTSLLGAPAADLKRYYATTDSLTALLDSTAAESDFSPSPSAPDARAQSNHTEETNEQASLITLVLMDAGLENFSSSIFYPRYYLSPITTTTYATQLSIPLRVDRKAYRASYERYSYTSLRATPRIEWYPSHTLGLGFDYRFNHTKFPGSSLYTFTEHAGRFDARLELSSYLCLVGEFGFGGRSYPNPMSIGDTFRLPGGRIITTTYTAPSAYTRLSPGIGFVFFPTEKFSIGIAGRTTWNPADSVTYLGGISARRFSNNSYFGLASDESYIYEVTSLVAAASWLLPSEIELGADVISEHRAYPPPPFIRGRLPSATRADDALWLTGSLSKYILYDERKLGFITSLYHRLSFIYTDIQSNLSGFSYSDLSFSFDISAGF